MPDNVILVDTSYTTFHRFFATMRWFSLAEVDIYKEHKDDPTYDWSLEPKFIEKYTKMYLKSIIDLVSVAVYDNSTLIFCLDSPHDSLWRHELSDCYKGKRIDLSAKYNFKPTFKYTYDVLIPKLMSKNIYSIMRPTMEADDIIALTTRFIKYKRPNRTIYIVSGDNDFLQLGYDNLYFVDYKKDTIHLTREQAKEALRVKIVTGDCSDNISSIFPKDEKISNKIKKLVRESKEEMKKYLSNNPKSMALYNHNIKMISFKYIPKHFRRPVYKIINKII